MMRAVIQRVKSARVEVNKRIIGKIDKGILIFLGIGNEDTKKDCEYIAKKIANLRIFEDEKELMNLSLMDIEGSALVVSQFTLWGDCRKGRRPSYMRAARPELAKSMYEYFIDILRETGMEVDTGEFQETMDVHLINDGPVTILLDSSKTF